MKTKTINLYTFDELSEESKKEVVSRIQKDRQEDSDVPWIDEIMDSLKAVFEVSGVKMQNWQIGPYGRSYLRAEFPGNYGDAVGELSHGRAMAWLESNLLGRLRVRPTFRDEMGRDVYSRKGGSHTPLKDSLRYHYRIGEIPSCPLTGVCFDEDFLDELQKDVKQGISLKDAFEGLAGTAEKMMEDEIDYYTSEEAILETLETDVEIYDEGGFEQ